MPQGVGVAGLYAEGCTLCHAAGDAHGRKLLRQILFCPTTVQIKLTVQIIIGLLNAGFLAGKLINGLIYCGLLRGLLLGLNVIVVASDFVHIVLIQSVFVGADVVLSLIIQVIIHILIVSILLSLVDSLIQKILDCLPVCSVIHGITDQYRIVRLPIGVSSVALAISVVTSGPVSGRIGRAAGRGGRASAWFYCSAAVAGTPRGPASGPLPGGRIKRRSRPIHAVNLLLKFLIFLVQTVFFSLRSAVPCSRVFIHLVLKVLDACHKITPSACRRSWPGRCR